MKTEVTNPANAFPLDPKGTIFPGMSHRDWFAGMALQGYVSLLTESRGNSEKIAARCYEFADGMLKERQK